MANERIMIVEDDPLVRQMLERFAQDQGYLPVSTDTAASARELLQQHKPDLLLLDIRLPDAHGLSLLKDHLLPELGPYRVIVLSAYNSQQDVEAAVMAGAFDYLTKPIPLLKLKIAMRNCLRLQELSEQMASYSARPVSSVSLSNLIGISEPMETLREQIKRIAPFDVPVMITGESGTGKELIARLIHSLSPRHLGPFLPLDCGALPETLVESELFGYERGTFTGAEQSKPGKLETADGGTILLDELGNLPLSSQPKLLRVLQSQSVERLGARQAIPLNVRVVSATNADLSRRIAEGTFRLDLFHRLNTFVLRVPPLRDRKADIPLLAH